MGFQWVLQYFLASILNVFVFSGLHSVLCFLYRWKNKVANKQDLPSWRKRSQEHGLKVNITPIHVENSVHKPFLLMSVSSMFVCQNSSVLFPRILYHACGTTSTDMYHLKLTTLMPFKNQPCFDCRLQCHSVSTVHFQMTLLKIVKCFQSIILLLLHCYLQSPQHQDILTL